METAAEYALLIREPPREEQISIGSAASLFLREGAQLYPSASVDTVEQVISAITVMSNGWLLVGTKLVQSKTHRDEQDKPRLVHDWGISSALAWPAFIRKMANAARSLGDTESTVAQYLRVRERQTRQASAVLWGDHGWPWEEAMRKSWEQDLSMLWTVTKQSNAFGIQVSIPGITDDPTTSLAIMDRPTDRPDQGREDWKRRRQEQPRFPRHLLNVQSKDLRPEMCCPAYNSGGCTEKQNDCPHQLLHRCCWAEQGILCGSQRHGKTGHSAATKARGGGKGGDKGGKGGKGKGGKGGKGAKR